MTDFSFVSIRDIKKAAFGVLVWVCVCVCQNNQQKKSYR